MSSLSINGIILLAFVSSSLTPSCVSDNRLLPNKPLTVGSKLISDDGTFALGFFSPTNSTKKHYYVGIWYNNIPTDNVVWVANRDTPITDPSSATLVLTNGSNLVVTNTKGQLLWVANIDATRNFSSEASSGEATLEHNGNFILRASNGVILWQSFEYPTDTLLPGMNLRLTHNSHPLQRLISWKDLHDPSPGIYSFGASPKEFLQRFIWNGSRPYRRSTVWNNYLVVGPYLPIIKSTVYMTVRRIDDEIFTSFGITGDSSSTNKSLDAFLFDSEDFPNLIAFAWSLWKDGNTKDFIDSSIVQRFALDEASRCIHVGLLGVQDNPNARPLMSSVVSILENGSPSLPTPKQPIYFAEKQPIYFAERNNGTYGAAETLVSCADTITVLEGR